MLALILFTFACKLLNQVFWNTALAVSVPMLACKLPNQTLVAVSNAPTLAVSVSIKPCCVAALAVQAVVIVELKKMPHMGSYNYQHYPDRTYL